MRTTVRRIMICLLVLVLPVFVLISGCGGSGKISLDKGMDALEKGDYDTAIGFLQKAARAMPNSASAHCNLGVACWKSGRLDDAAVSLRRAAELTPNEAEPLEFLGNVFIDQNKFDDASSAFDKAMERSYRSARLLAFMAVANLHAGNSIAARELLTEALGVDKDYLPAIYNMAVLYRDVAKNEKEAAKYFKRFLDVAKNPNRLGPPVDKVCLADAELFLNPPQKVVSGKVNVQPAEPAFSVSAKITAMMTEAEAAVEHDELITALKKIKEAVALDVNNPDPLWALAVLYDKNLGHSQKAMDVYNEFKRRFPADRRVGLIVEPSANKASVSVPDKTTIPLQPVKLTGGEVVSAQGGTANVLFERGLKCQEAGDLVTAIDLYTRALEKDGSFYNAAYNMGLARKRLGQLEEAKSAFKQALAIEPDMVKACYMLALVHKELMEYDDAIILGNRALKIQPDYSKVHYLLGIVYAMKDRSDLARGHFNNCINSSASGDPLAEKARECLNGLR